MNRDPIRYRNIRQSQKELEKPPRRWKWTETLPYTMKKIGRFKICFSLLTSPLKTVFLPLYLEPKKHFKLCGVWINKYSFFF